MRLQDLQAHLAHDLVVRLLEDPMSKAVLTSGLARHEIHVRDRDMRVRITTVAIQMHNDITGRVRCNFLSECIGSISDDRRRHRIVRVELVGRERLDDHQRLILPARALQHRLDLGDRVVGVMEVGSPCRSTRLLDVRGLAEVRVHDRRRCAHGRCLLRNTHADNSFATRSSALVASSRRAIDGAAPAHP